MRAAVLTVAEAKRLLPAAILKLAEFPEKEARDASSEDLRPHRVSRRGKGKTTQAPIEPPWELIDVLRAAEELLRSGLHGIYNSAVGRLADACGEARKGGF